MPPSLPVPSEAALRALRHIALGTSCTVAIGAGLITEDRRRRIHSVREVRENGQRLRKSRKYHSGGGLVGDVFEGQSMHYGDYAFGNLSRRLEEQDDWSQKAPELPLFTRDPCIRSIQKEKKQDKKDSIVPRGSCSSPLDGRCSSGVDSVDRRATSIKPPPLLARYIDTKAIAQKMVDNLQQHTGLHAIRTTAQIFMRSLEAGIPVVDSQRPLIEACVLLWEICGSHEAYDIYRPVLQNLLKYIKIDVQTAEKLGVYGMSEYFLNESGAAMGSRLNLNSDSYLSTQDSAALVREGVILFMTKTSQVQDLTPSNHELGSKLVSALESIGEWGLLVKLFWFIHARRGDLAVKHLLPLIMAESSLGRRKRVLTLFNSFHKDVIYTQHEFYQLINLVLEAALSLQITTLQTAALSNEVLVAEDILVQASEIAQAQTLKVSTTWSLKVLEHHWTSEKNLQRLLRAYDRIERHFKNVSHPEAIYSFMVDKALRAGDIATANTFVERVKSKQGDVDIKTRGHFALANARHEKWEESETDLEAMCRLLESMTQVANFDARLLSQHIQTLQTTFNTLVKLYASSHNTKETESYVARYVQRAHLHVDDTLNIVMVTMYAKAGELSSIASWLDYTQKLGCTITSVSFNAMLNMLVKKFNIPKTGVFALCKRVQALRPELIDTKTGVILRHVIKRSTKDNPMAAGLWQQRIDTLLHESLARNHQTSTPVAQAKTLETKMSDLLQTGQFFNCLRVYYGAFGLAGQCITPQQVRMAVEACMRSQLPDCRARATTIIKQAQARNVDITISITPLLLHQINTPETSSSAIKDMVHFTLAMLQKKQIAFPRKTATTIASILVANRNYRAAIALWTTLWKYNSRFERDMDVVDLTVLFNAYLNMNNMDGLRWVMKSMSENDLFPDEMFKMYVKNNRRDKKHYMEANPGNYEARIQYQVLDECWQTAKALRAEKRVNKDVAMRKTLLIMKLATQEQAHKRSNTASKETNDFDQSNGSGSETRDIQEELQNINEHTAINGDMQELVGSDLGEFNSETEDIDSEVGSEVNLSVDEYDSDLEDIVSGDSASRLSMSSIDGGYCVLKGVVAGPSSYRPFRRSKALLLTEKDVS